MTAANVRTVGNQMQPSTNTIAIARKPHLLPNASPTQRNMPPSSGHVDASSAATTATGARKQTAASR
ncbi:Uncharacterised protein [Mycobacteroides abscessus]|nr:Uncharacterised protein [Mycobacteroides abscessus]